MNAVPFFYGGDFPMLRLLSASVICLGLMSGCATTQKLASKVNLGSSGTPLQQVLKFCQYLQATKQTYLLLCLNVITSKHVIVCTP